MVPSPWEVHAGTQVKAAAAAQTMQSTREREGEDAEGELREARSRGRKGTFYPPVFRAVRTRQRECPARVWELQGPPRRGKMTRVTRQDSSSEGTREATTHTEGTTK